MKILLFLTSEKSNIMNNNAIAIANYFVDKANNTPNKKNDLTLLRLVKYVYIAYGFALAILDRVIIDKRFDKVEAWKYGPVIPSVYHSFKHNKNNPITGKSSILIYEENTGEMDFKEPEITDPEIKALLDFVWERYDSKDISELIDLLHKDGTPWKYCYQPGKNVEIHDELTKLYYNSIVQNALKS